MTSLKVICFFMLVACAMVMAQGPKKQEPRGKVDGNIDYKRGVGVIGNVEASRDFIRSKDGNTRLSAGAYGSKVIAGPMRHTKPSYGGFVNFEHRFRRSA